LAFAFAFAMDASLVWDLVQPCPVCAVLRVVGRETPFAQIRVAAAELRRLAQDAGNDNEWCALEALSHTANNELITTAAK